MAEMSVTGGVFATLTPIFTLWYGHKDITYDITPYVTSISYHDSIKTSRIPSQLHWMTQMDAG